MKNSILLYLLIAIVSVGISCSDQTNQQVLFQENGTDWFAEGDAKWIFENNELIGTLAEGTGFVMTKASYTDFELELEFLPDSTINSGIFIRCKNKEISNVDCYELNIWDLHPNQENRTGAVVTRTTPLENVETIGKWNTYKIRNENDHLQAWINGVPMVDIEDQNLTEGPIALQAAGEGEIKFRNVKLITLVQVRKE